MFSAKSSRRRNSTARPRGESLETRNLLTSGAGNTIALVSGTVAEAAKPATASFTITEEHFTLPQRSILLGLDVAASSKSQLKPMITAVTSGKTGKELGTIRSFYSEAVGDEAGELSSAALVRLNVPGGGGRNKAPASFQVEISGEENTTGGYLLGYYLPGDVDGDGIVEQSDLKTIRDTQQAAIGQSRYNFNADSNRDGQITSVDLNLARSNLGIRTTIQPILSANLDEASDSGVQNRITVFKDVIFNGTGTPGATVTFEETSAKAPKASAKIAEDGTYSLIIPLGLGENRFRVTSVDGFGQVITGELSPVTYEQPLVPVESPKTPKNPPKPVVQVTTTPNTPKPAGQAPRADQAAKLRERLASQKKPS